MCSCEPGQQGQDAADECGQKPEAVASEGPDRQDAPASGILGSLPPTETLVLAQQENPEAEKTAAREQAGDAKTKLEAEAGEASHTAATEKTGSEGQDCLEGPEGQAKKEGPEGPSVILQASPDEPPDSRKEATADSAEAPASLPPVQTLVPIQDEQAAPEAENPAAHTQGEETQEPALPQAETSEAKDDEQKQIEGTAAAAEESKEAAAEATVKPEAEARLQWTAQASTR